MNPHHFRLDMPRDTRRSFRVALQFGVHDSAPNVDLERNLHTTCSRGGGAVGKAEYLSARPSLSNARLPVSFLARSQEQPRLSLVVTSVGRFEVARLRRIN